MKKISSFLLISMALMLSGCYADLGNYDYRLDSMNEIKSAAKIIEYYRLPGDL